MPLQGLPVRSDCRPEAELQRLANSLGCTQSALLQEPGGAWRAMAVTIYFSHVSYYTNTVYHKL